MINSHATVRGENREDERCDGKRRIPSIRYNISDNSVREKYNNNYYYLLEFFFFCIL